MPETGKTLRGLAVLAWVAMSSACTLVPERDRPPEPGAGRPSISDPAPRAEPLSRLGNPCSYVVNGRQYFTLASARGFVQRGIASWYGPKFHGLRTSSGETYDMHEMTAAHKTLPPADVRPGAKRRDRTGDSWSGSMIAARSTETGSSTSPMRRQPGWGSRAGEPDWSRCGRWSPGLRRGAPGRDGRSARTCSGPGRLFIQAGAFQAEARAAGLRNRLAAGTELPVRVRRAVSDGQVMYRVWLGPVSSAEEADRVSRGLGVFGIESPRIVVE